MLIWKDFEDILNGNVRHSLGLVEGKVSEKQFPLGGISKGSPGILGGEARTAPWGRVGQEWPLPTDPWPLTVDKRVGDSGKDSGIVNGPPSWASAIRSLWSWERWRFMTFCSPGLTLGSKSSEGAQFTWKLKQSPELTGGEGTPVPFLLGTPGEDKSSGSYSKKHLLRAPWGLWVWGGTSVSRGSMLVWPQWLHGGDW